MKDYISQEATLFHLCLLPMGQLLWDEIPLGENKTPFEKVLSSMKTDR